MKFIYFLNNFFYNFFLFFFMQRFIPCRFLDVANIMLEITDFVQTYDFLAFWLLILAFRGWQLCF